MDFLCFNPVQGKKCDQQCNRCGMTVEQVKQHTKDTEIKAMQPGKMYYIRFGQTSIVGRYMGDDACNLKFFTLLHYWEGFQNFRHVNAYCVKHGIDEIRPASDAEKLTLFRHEIEHQCV